MKTSWTFQTIRFLLIAVLSMGVASASAQDLEIQVEDIALMPVPAHLTYPTEFLVDGKAYYFGGIGSTGNVVIGFDEMWELDVATGVMSELPFKLPYELTMAPHAAAVHIDGHVYMSPGFATGDAGGWGSHRRVIDVDLVEETTAETFAFPPSRIWGSAAVGANDKVYFLGGWTGGPQSSIFELDPKAGTFVQVASMLGASNDVLPTLGSDGWIYYWGRLLSDIQRFNPTTYQVESTGVAMVTGGGGQHRAYVRWHLPAERQIYFTKPGNKVSPSSALYLYDYGDGVLTSTGVFVPQDLVNQTTTLDPDDPSVIYAYRIDTRLDDPLYVSRVRLAPTCLFGLADSPARFERARGKPVYESATWESCGGEGMMIVEAFGVSSAFLYLNGELILVPSDFNGGDVKLEVPMSLDEGINSLDVQLRGAPGGVVEVRFEAD